MDTCHEVEGVRNSQPSREHGDISDEADFPHELIALGPRIAFEYLELALIGSETQNRLERRRLAGAVPTDEPKDAALLDAQIDTVQRDRCAESLTQAVCFYAWHDFSAPLTSSAISCRLRQRPAIPPV